MAWHRNLPRPSRAFSPPPVTPSIRDVSLRGLMEMEFPQMYPMSRNKLSDGVTNKDLQQQQRERFRPSHVDYGIPENQCPSDFENNKFRNIPRSYAQPQGRERFEDSHSGYWHTGEQHDDNGQFRNIPRSNIQPQRREKFEDSRSGYWRAEEQHRNEYSSHSSVRKNSKVLDIESFELIKKFLQSTDVEEQSGQKIVRKSSHKSVPQTFGSWPFSDKSKVNKAGNSYSSFEQSLNNDEMNLSTFTSELFNSGKLIDVFRKERENYASVEGKGNGGEESVKDMTNYVKDLYARIEKDREKILKNLQEKNVHGKADVNNGKSSLNEHDPGLPVPSPNNQTKEKMQHYTSETVSQPMYSSGTPEASLYQSLTNKSYIFKDVPAFPSLLGKLLHSATQNQNYKGQDERKLNQDRLGLSSESLALHWKTVKEKLGEEEAKYRSSPTWQHSSQYKDLPTRRSTSRSPQRARYRHHRRSRSRSPPRRSRLSPLTARIPSPQQLSSPPRGLRISTSKKRRSPRRFRSPSPWRLRSPSPRRLRRLMSSSPERLRSPSPRRFRSPSPRRFRSPSPRRFRSPSPRRFRSPSPRRLRSPSPRRLRSQSPRGLRRSGLKRLSSPEMDSRRSACYSPNIHDRNHRSQRSRSRSPVMHCNEDSSVRLIDALKLVFSALRKSKTNYDLIAVGECGSKDVLHMGPSVKKDLLLGKFQLRFSKISDHISSNWQRAVTDLLDVALENNYNHEVYVDVSAHDNVISIHNTGAYELAEYIRGVDVVIHFSFQQEGQLNNNFDLHSIQKPASVFHRLGQKQDASREDVLSNTSHGNVFSRLGNKHNLRSSISDSSKLEKVYNVEFEGVEDKIEEEIVCLGENLGKKSNESDTKNKGPVHSRLGKTVPQNDDVVYIGEDVTEDATVDATKFPKSMYDRLSLPKKKIKVRL